MPAKQNLKAEIATLAGEALDEMSVALNKEDRRTLMQELYDEVMGLGPLEPLLKDDTVNDILVNGPQRIFVERAGKLDADRRDLPRRTPPVCASSTRSCPPWAAGSMNRTPIATPVLQDGSRFNCMVPPVAVDGIAGLHS